MSERSLEAFFLSLKRLYQDISVVPRLPKLLRLMGEAYAIRDPDVCHSQICSWPLFLSLHLTPEANKGQQKPDLLEQAHTEVRGLPCRAVCQLTRTSLRKGNRGVSVSFAVSQEPEDWPYVNARLIWVERRREGKIRITTKKYQKHMWGHVTVFLRDLCSLQVQKGEK